MVQINVREIEKQLIDANLPREEISIVVHNFTELEGAGLSDNDISIVVHNIVDDTKFRELFIKDPRSAIRQVRGEFQTL